VSKNGIIAIVCQEGSGSNDSGRHVVYRSTDNGLSFQRGSALIPSRFDYIVDPPYAIAFDTTGALWVLWGWDWLPGGFPAGSYLDLSKSTDNGMSFSTVLRHWRGLIVKPSRMIIDAHNDIHLLRDSVLAAQGPRIVYTKLPNGNASNRFDALLPFAQGADNGNNRADMAVSSDNVIHYVNRIMRYTGTAYEFKVEYSRSLDGGLSFSPLVVVDSITPPNQLSPKILARDSLVIIAYNFPDSSASHLAVVSTNNGSSFGSSFGFGSDLYGLPGRITSDSQNIYLFYPVYDHPFTGRGRTVFNRFTNPLSPPEEIARFDSLFGDLAVGTTGGKYAVFEKQGTSSVLFSGKDIPTSVSMWPSTIPNTFSLRAYPNPFNPSTTITYQLPSSAAVSLKVFSLLGQEVATLVNEQQTAGTYSVQFNGSNLSSGVYIYKLEARSFVASRKLVLMK
jgi:hypothetical protein